MRLHEKDKQAIELIKSIFSFETLKLSIMALLVYNFYNLTPELTKYSYTLIIVILTAILPLPTIFIKSMRKKIKNKQIKKIFKFFENDLINSSIIAVIFASLLYSAELLGIINPEIFFLLGLLLLVIITIFINLIFKLNVFKLLIKETKEFVNDLNANKLLDGIFEQYFIYIQYFVDFSIKILYAGGLISLLPLRVSSFFGIVGVPSGIILAAYFKKLKSSFK